MKRKTVVTEWKAWALFDAANGEPWCERIYGAGDEGASCHEEIALYPRKIDAERYAALSPARNGLKPTVSAVYLRKEAL